MPVYEYVCTVCEAPLEAIVLPGEPVPQACPHCGETLRREWSRLGVQLVGWGFARNDAMLPDDGKRKSFKNVKDKAAELFD